MCTMSSSKVNGIIFATAAVVVLGGCAVSPKVELTKINSSADLKGDEIDTFYIQRSIIKIDKENGKPEDEKAPAATEPVKLSISSIPAEFTKFKFGLRKADSLGVKTNINITKIQNTDLIKEVGTEVIDKRIELIEKIGSIVTTLAPIVFDSSKGLEDKQLPKLIQTHVLLENGGVGKDAKESIDAGDGVTIDFGALPPDAVPLADLKLPEVTGSLVYAACRSATVKFERLGQKYEQTVKISDPRSIQKVSFPLKGKISFHSECGASVVSDKDTGVSSEAAIVEALARQGKAIKDAIDAAKK